MGISCMGSCGRASSGNSYPEDPIPSRFKIVRLEQHGRFVIGVINYPNCTTFNGSKILVWEDTTVDEVENMKSIDPHFLEDSKIVARFAPTLKGKQYAIDFVNSQIKVKK